MKKSAHLQKTSTFKFVTQKEHEKNRNERLRSWIEPLLPIGGRLTICETLVPWFKTISENNLEAFIQPIFVPPGELNPEIVFTLDLTAHDVVYEESDYPEFYFCFLYSGKVYVVLSLLREEDEFEFLAGFYSKKLQVEFGPKELNAVRFECSSWNEAYALISNILKTRLEILPSFR